MKTVWNLIDIYDTAAVYNEYESNDILYIDDVLFQTLKFSKVF